jgi:hypothetical protein
MTELTYQHFSLTTVDDQNNYFSGDVKSSPKIFEGSFVELAPGQYRVIDGELCRIASGLTPEEVRQTLDSITVS